MSEENKEPRGFPQLPEEEPPLPKPAPRSGDRLRLAVGLAVAAGIAFWLSGTITQQRKAEDTAQVSAPAANATAQAGPGLSLPVGGANGMQAQVAPPPGAQEQTEAFAEDPVVPSSFFRLVARWAVAQYQPPQSRHNGTDKPWSNLTVSRLNARFGTEEDAFGPGKGSGPELRRRVLAYALQPGFVGYLGKNYMEPFLGFLRDAATEARRDYRTAKGLAAEPLRAADAAAMFRLYAALAADTGKVLSAAAAHGEIAARVAGVHAASAKVAKAYERTWNAGDAGNAGAGASEADAVIRQAVADRAAAQAAAIRTVREKTGPLVLDDDETFYVAEWAARRLAAPGQKDGLAAAGGLLADLAQRLQTLANDAEAAPAAQ